MILASSTSLNEFFANVVPKKKNEHIHLVPISNGSKLFGPSHREDDNVQGHTYNKLNINHGTLFTF